MNLRQRRELFQWVSDNAPVMKETPTHKYTQAGPTVVSENKQTGALTVFVGTAFNWKAIAE